MGVFTLRGLPMATATHPCVLGIISFRCHYHHKWVHNPFTNDAVAIVVAAPLSVNAPIWFLTTYSWRKQNIRLCKNYTKVTRGGVMKCHEMSCNVMSGILETMFPTFKMLTKIILILFDHKGILCYAKWETAWQSTGWCMGETERKSLTA